MVAVALFVGFIIGALVVIGVEIAGVLFLIKKLGEKEEEVKVAKSIKDELQYPSLNKQGWVWILEKEKIPKTSQSQQKRKLEIFDVTPVKKHASIKDKSLIITEADGTHTQVCLSGCVVEAVSAANLASRKWAKKYPVKVENKSSVIYHGSKLFYMYFEASCEKESWCKSLRLASCDDNEKLIWFHNLRAEFYTYLTSLNVEYPSFLKPCIGFNVDIGDKSIKVDGSSSKVRHFLKKFTKKNFRSGREDKRITENVVVGSLKASQTEKKGNDGGEEKTGVDCNEKMSRDDGTLCCSLLISRLFFDAKNNMDLRTLMQAHIQRILSTAKTPSFVGEIICTGVDPGIIPPYIHGMRVVPSDLKEVVAVELDIEYYGGAVLDIETRIEVHELENPDSKTVDVVTPDLIEGFEHIGEQIKLNEQTNQAVDHKDDERRKLGNSLETRFDPTHIVLYLINLLFFFSEESKTLKGIEQTSSSLPKWKSVINSVAKQVSQVPLSLAIRVTTLRGTLRLYIKPPPSDQVWFGFTSMPDVDFSLASAVGDHKITSGHIALFIINKFKAAIRETMVLPNCESATVHFMLAEKNDWIPQKSAPFIWANPETPTEPNTEPSDEIQRQDINSSSKSSTDTTDDEHLITNDEKTLLLDTEEQHLDEAMEENREVALLNSQNVSPHAEEHNEATEVDSHKLKRSSTRAKMLGFRKKMGEKLEEKRRNIEEKGRHMVGKMRGPG
ncbi:uncharacterized protein LOC143560173 [Bidens hawaiensis]|uniref:uncharacterized protein LOC143560173 n=1 Tax=Bidens hawaiensis TaxID=980011 RepID=UPI00404B6EFB